MNVFYLFKTQHDLYINLYNVLMENIMAKTLGEKLLFFSILHIHIYAFINIEKKKVYLKNFHCKIPCKSRQIAFSVNSLFLKCVSFYAKKKKKKTLQ